MEKVRKKKRSYRTGLCLSGTVSGLLLFACSSWAQNVNYTYDALNRLTRLKYQGNAVIEYTYDTAGNRTSQVVRSIVPTPVVVNNFVTSAPITSSFSSTANTSGCPAGFLGKFIFNANLSDKISSPSLSNLLVKVTTLTNGNLLQNPDGGAGYCRCEGRILLTDFRFRGVCL